MPVVARCPLHGSQIADALDFMNSSNVTFKGSRTTCHYCGRYVPLMEGTYNFDEMGIAQVVSAPQWSRQALVEVQERLQAAAKEQNDAAISDVQADHAWDDLVDSVRMMSTQLHTVSDRLGEVQQQSEDVKAELAEVRSELSDTKGALADALAAAKGKPRWKRAALLWSVIAVISTIGGIPQGVDVIADATQWAQLQVEQALHPEPADSPPPQPSGPPSTAVPPGVQQSPNTTSPPRSDSPRAATPEGHRGQRQQQRRLPRSKRDSPRSP